MRSLAFAVVLLLVSPAANAGSTLRVLFVGNSLTYTNDLPAIVSRMGTAGGHTIETKTVAFPNFSLEDHLADGRAKAMLDSGRWDFVVLQQGSSALEESRRILLRDTTSFAALIGRKKARVALLTVWPRRSRLGDFPRVIESYALAAEAVGGTLIPAGAAWHSVLRSHDADLYAEDGLHPSPLGSWLSALAVYRVLVGPIPDSFHRREGVLSVMGRSIGAFRFDPAVLVNAVEASVP